MKKTGFFFVVALIFHAVVLSTATAQNHGAVLPRHLDPTAVSQGKEPARGLVVSHPSRADAVRTVAGAGRYLQPLTDWIRTETADVVTYTTGFKIPFGWIDRRQFLYVGRTTGSFDVSINGVRAAYSQSGSTPSEFDITAVAREGANDLAITIYKTNASQKLENSRPAAPSPRLEGKVWILSQPLVRVRDVAVSTRMEGATGLLELGVILKSHRLNPHDYTVHWELLDPLGRIVAEGRKGARLEERREDTVRFFAAIPRIAPWSHEDPRLYTLYIKTQNEGRFREHVAFRIGFRSYSLSTRGRLMLNGVPVDPVMLEFSPSVDAAAMRAEVTRLKAGGVGGLVLRGSPPDHGFLSLCDSVGMYVVARADIDTRHSGPSRRAGGNPSNDPIWLASYLDRTLSMYHTSKNHPSVAMFSLASASANGYNLYESYLALKALESHRPVIYTDGESEWNSDALASDATPATPAAPADWLALTAVDAAEGRFRLANSRRIAPFVGEAVYNIVVGRKSVAAGAVPVEVLAAERTEFVIPVAGVKPGKAFTVELDIAAERTDGDYLPANDPDLKVYRRLDQPLAAEHRTTLLRAEFPVGK